MGWVVMKNYFKILISKYKEQECSIIFFVVVDIVFIIVVVY